MSQVDSVRSTVSEICTEYFWSCPLNHLLESAIDGNTFPALYQFQFNRGWGAIEACKGGLNASSQPF